MAQAATVPRQERTTRLVAIGAVIFAALAAVLLFVALQSRGDGGGSSSVSTVNVVVAAQAISANTTLTADMLKVDAIPSDSLLAGAYASTDRVVGLPLRYPVQAGEQVTAAKLGTAAIEEEKDIAYVLETGERGYSIEAAEVSSVGGLLLAENRVDVIAVYKGRAFTVLQNITVLSVAQEAQEPVPAAATPVAADGSDQASGGITGQRPEDIERQPGARSITLDVTPEQAQLLAALQDNGDVSLSVALRSVDDTAGVDVPPTDLFQLFGIESE